MRKIIFYSGQKLASICLFILILKVGSAKGGDVQQNLEDRNVNKETKISQITKGNFLVVGSFLLLKNAQSYTNALSKNSHNASMAFYPGNKHYYVYLFESKDLEEVRGRRDRVRNLDEFKDAWILSIGENRATAIQENKEVVIHEEKPEEETKHEEVVKEAKVVKPGMKDYNLYLNVVSATNYKEVPANIQMVNIKEGKVTTVLEAHKTQTVEMPINGSHEVQLICEAFGYKKIEQELDFNQPVSEATKNHVQMIKDTILVNFELVRYKKGDLFTMFNVFFYNDAAIMLPKSIYELNALVDMVKENENLQIKLHGHTNGNDYGRIIKLAPDDKDYFELKPTNIQSKGSARDLSFARADIIRRYLIEQGIDEKRIEVKGWGGSKMLYPIKSPDAKKNVRVEVEILKD